MSACLRAGSSRELIFIGMLLPSVMLECKIIFLEMDLAGCLFFKFLKSKEPSQSRMVGMQVEFLSIAVFVEMFKSVHNRH